jgi:hypothetical protein
MPSRLLVAVLAFGALLIPGTATGAQPGPAVPASITLPTKIVQGQSTVGTVCLDRVPDSPTEVFLSSDNTFLAEVAPASVVISPPDQCADFTVTSFDRGFTETINVVIGATANGDSAQWVLAIIPREGVDLIEITKADVDRNFRHLTVIATSDEPGAVLTAYFGETVLGVLEPKGSRYTGRFDLNGLIVNNVTVKSDLGGCAQRAVPFGNNSTHC